MLLRSLYIVFLGVLIALFTGVGIATFYKTPPLPQPLSTPPVYFGTLPPASDSAMQAKQQAENFKINDQYQNSLKNYSRNVSEIAIVMAVALLVIGLATFKGAAIISDSIVLGAVLTLSYSIIRGLMSGDEVARFIVVTIGLIFAIVLGYIKFNRPAQKKKK